MNRKQPDIGSIYYFVHLHLDTASQTSTAVHKVGHVEYRIEGKPRPMVVLGTSRKRSRGQNWYFVARLTTKGRDESGKVLPDFFPVGNCIEKDLESFVALELQKLPENLLWYEEENCGEVTPINRLEVAAFIKILNHRLLGGKTNATKNGFRQ